MNQCRSIAVITTTRADYGLFYWILRAIEVHPGLDLRLVVAGTHLSPAHGLTQKFIEQDGFEIAATVDYLQTGDGELEMAISAGQAVQGFARALRNLRPDIVLLLGDRYEVLAAAFAAATLRIAIGHIHGGEVTEGALDEAYRHAVTKLSQLHFAATDQAAGRILQLGEQPERVHVCGAPGIETIARARRMDFDDLAGALSHPIEPGFILVTYHPATLSEQPVGDQMGQLLTALSGVDRQLVITKPNADAGFGQIARTLEKFCGERASAYLFSSVGQEIYVNLMRHAAAMVGNSSSGIIEAASIPLAVVNIGGRQHGRLRPDNVIDVACDADDIVEGIRQAVSDDFRRSLSDLQNPYGDGRTAERITEVLATVQLDQSLLRKPFYDMSVAEGTVR